MLITKKQILATLCISLSICLGLGYLLFFSSLRNEDGTTYLYVDSDDTADSVFAKLRPQVGTIPYAGIRLSALALGYGGQVPTGCYAVKPELGAFRLLRNLRGGRQEPVKLVIPVAHTVGHLAARLADKLEADSAELMQAFTAPAEMEALGVTKETLPCLFIPNTYEVYWDIAPAKLLQKMKKESDRFWNGERRAKAAEAGLTPEQVVTIASIVEQESANADERPMIAGMYLNRLRTGMKLQADPTVKFALQNFSLRRILHEHLMADSPYNTYVNAGLPPGPICIPSMNAIESVLSYVHHDYMYMCAKEDFSGTHNFAKTYTEHLANARKYTAALNARGIK